MSGKVNPALDYRFAWRWLLPVPDNGQQRVWLKGFDDAEQRFWQSALAPAEWVNKAQDATVWLVDADRCAPESPLAMSRMASLETVAVVGNRATINPWRRDLRTSFRSLREYGLLPANQPRVVIPLDTPSHAVTALGLHRPGRRLARWGVRIARILARWGILFPLRQRVLLIAVREPGVAPTGAVQADLPDRLPELGSSYALYLGSQDRDGNRKTVALPLGHTEPSVLLKVGATAKAQYALNREAAALEALRESPIRTQIPRLIRQVDNGSGLALFQEYRARRPVRRQRMEDAVIDFLARLSAINRRSRPLAQVLAEIAAASAGRVADQASAGVWNWLQLQAKQGMQVWEHCSHGDFAPWNCAWTEQGLFVYDWEESQEWDLALSDAFYYVIAPVLHVQQRPHAKKTLDAVLPWVEQVAMAGELGLVPARCYLALWLLKQTEQTHLYDEMMGLLEAG